MTRELGITRWSHNLPDADTSRRLLVLPGANYPVAQPGLALPIRALSLLGWEVWHATWDMSDASNGEAEAMVQAAVERLDAETAGAARRLVLAKSVGTLAAGWVADAGLPAIWTTPLLDRDTIVGHIARASAPALLVGGSADRAWDPQAAGRTGKEAVEVPGANHAWLTGDWRTELDVLRQLTGAVDEFARRLG